jgi:hypothetical protein
MAVRTLYFDESGFTGYNLLDPLQPIFAIASADIAEDQAREILRDSFPRYRGTEFKFSNIWGSNSRAGLLRFAAHLERLRDLAFIYMADKRFAVLTKIVDFLIEPYVTDGGYDFYADGFCWKYVNYIYFGLTQFAPPELLDALLRHYQTFSRNPTPEGLATLQARLGMMAASTDDRVKIFLEQMALGAALFERYHSLENFHGSYRTGVSAIPTILPSFMMNHQTSSEAATCGERLQVRTFRLNSIAAVMAVSSNIPCV